MVKREREDPKVIQRRWDKKKEQIEVLANNIQKLRYNVTLGLKDTDNEKVFLTALVVAIILETSERVGNEVSAQNQHVGITGLKKKQISIDGNKVTLEYTGKSGVEHVKSFSDEKIAKALKLAIKRSKTDDVFCTSDGFKIKSDRVNRYLSDFSVRSKDIRGFSSNKWMLEKLKNGEIEDNENKRKKFFMQSLRKTAIKVGHGASTLRKHYLIPELETNYIKTGTIINLNERDSYEEGGEIKSVNNNSVKYNKDIEFKCNYEKYFEYVPLSEIEKYIEFDREIEHKISKNYLDELTEEIKVNGITYPITLEVYGNKGLIVEGNHRIAVAKRLGIKYIPVRVVERTRPIKGTIYENKFKELPSSRNMYYAKAMYNVNLLDSDNSAAVYGFTKVESKFSLGGSINRKLTYLGEVGGDRIGQKSSLEKAKLLENKGFSSEEIRKETGWFLNPYDKKWRFEISDEDFDIIQNFSEIKKTLDNDKSLTFVKKNLDEVVKHDKLFAAYPEFRNVPFIFYNENITDFVGIYTSKKDNLQLKYNLYDERKRLEKSGGLESIRIFRNQQAARRIFNILNEFMGAATTKESDRLGDEIYRFRRNILAHELQHIIQIREELGGGSSPIWWYKELTKRTHLHGRPIGSYSESDLHLESDYFYHNSSGEIEAKDVDARLDFSEEKRKEVIPLSLVRVNPKYVTVDLEKPRFENGGEIEKINFDNFHKGTIADFKEILRVGIPKRKPNFVSESGSKYWFTANSVIRQSDHWGQLDTCKWTLDGRSGYKISQGICDINNFKKQ